MLLSTSTPTLTSESLHGAQLYGVDQSPWVAGVRLAFDAHDVPLRLTSVPLSLRWFWQSGFVFPALRLADTSTHIDSFAIYALLESRGFDLGIGGVCEEQRVRLQADLERLFAAYALGRCGPGRNVAFVDAWSRMRDDPFTWRGLALRGLVVHYFHVLIQIGRWRARRRERAPFDLAVFESVLSEWDARLGGSDWFTGAEVGFVDYAVFGHLQCMTSGLTDALFPALRRQTGLMDWAQRMIARHPMHEPMYVRRLFGQSSRVREVSVVERAAFWLAWLGWLLLLPVSATAVLTAVLRRSRNPAHTGAVLRRSRRS